MSITKRSRGVSNTRCRAMVNSTTPRFGPRCPPVCERTLISSSRTSCASWGKSCSLSALISAGERIPSSNRAVLAVASEAGGDSEESDFFIGVLGFIDHAARSRRLGRWLEIFNRRLAGAVAGNDLDLLLRVGKPFLANFYQIHSFFVAHDQIFQGQLARFHLLDDSFEALHRSLKVRLCLA